MTTATLEATEHLPSASPAVRAALSHGKELPLLDVGPYLAGVPGALDQLAADVRLIQQGLGFFAIINHGIPTSLVEESFRQVAELFEISDEEKQKHRVGYHHQGYLPPNASILKSAAIEKIAVNTKKDTNLAWLFMRERTADDPKVIANVRHRGLNQWPESLPAFRKALGEYQRSMEQLSLKLLPVYARALGLAANYFDSMFKTPEWYQRCAYYNPEKEMEEGRYALAPHSDGSFLTLLPMTPIPGLQVMTPSRGSWTDSTRAAAILGGALGELHDGRDRGGEFGPKSDTSSPETTCATGVMTPMNIEQSVDR